MFGAGIDFAQIIKQYGPDPEAEKRYSPAKCIGVDTRTVTGSPDPGHISISYVERANLTMRMGMRRFTQVTNAFSKKFETSRRPLASTSCTTTSVDPTRRSRRPATATRPARRWRLV